MLDAMPDGTAVDLGLPPLALGPRLDRQHRIRISKQPLLHLIPVCVHAQICICVCKCERARVCAPHISVLAGYEYANVHTSVRPLR